MPGILGVEIRLQGTEVLWYQGSLRDRFGRCRAIVLAVNLGNDTDNVCDCVIVGIGVVRIDCWKSKCRGIQTAPASRGLREQIGRICGSVVYVRLIGSPRVCDQADVGSKLQRVLPLRPA